MTPDFPAFAPLFAQQRVGLRTTLGATLHQFEALAQRWIPCHRLAQCQARHLHAVFRVRGSRRRDLRQGKALGSGERLVQWRKPSQRPRTVSPEEWDRLPEFLCLRLVHCRFDVPGFRTREVLLVTTLLDRQRYPLRALSALYRRRWEMELTLRHLKITLQMDQLSCKTPQNLAREIRLHLLVHNFTRCLMLQAARCHGVAHRPPQFRRRPGGLSPLR